ncbi:MAG: ChrR family anti-sigma-E factor [Rhodospirillales bacterium]
MICHHPPPELLLDYASGAAAEGAALVIASHVAWCPACREEVAKLEEVGGELLLSVPEEPVGELLLQDTLARLDAATPSQDAVRGFDQETRRLVPAPLRRYIGRNLGELDWRSAGGMFREAQIPLSCGHVRASLMRLQPGCPVTPHTHVGNEFVLVLDGGYSDGDQRYGPGDFDVKFPGCAHHPVVDDPAGCFSLVVLDGPVRPLDGSDPSTDPLLDLLNR